MSQARGRLDSQAAQLIHPTSPTQAKPTPPPRTNAKSAANIELKAPYATSAPNQPDHGTATSSTGGTPQGTPTLLPKAPPSVPLRSRIDTTRETQFSSQSDASRGSSAPPKTQAASEIEANYSTSSSAIATSPTFLQPMSSSDPGSDSGPSKPTGSGYGRDHSAGSLGSKVAGSSDGGDGNELPKQPVDSEPAGNPGPSQSADNIKAWKIAESREGTLETHSKSPHYSYSVTDGFMLTSWIRKTVLNYDSKQNVQQNSYLALQENQSGIFLADPYSVEEGGDNFASYLKDDLSQIASKWKTTPKAIIIPIILGHYWRCVVVTKFGTDNIKVLFDDPCGVGQFPTSLKASVMDKLGPHALKLWAGAAGSVAIDEPFQKIPAQQKLGQDGWNSGTIIFSNIVSYINYITDYITLIDQKSDVKQASNIKFSIPDHEHKKYKEIIKDLRTKDVQHYVEMKNIDLDMVRLLSVQRHVNDAFVADVDAKLQLISQSQSVLDNLKHAQVNTQIISQCATFEASLADETSPHSKSDVYNYIYTSFCRLLQSSVRSAVNDMNITALHRAGGSWWESTKQFLSCHGPTVAPQFYALTQGLKVLMGEPQVADFAKKLQHFTDNRTEDTIIADYATRMTEFYQYDIRAIENEVNEDQRAVHEKAKKDFYNEAIRKSVIAFIDYIAIAKVDHDSYSLGIKASEDAVSRWFREKFVINVEKDIFDEETALTLASISDFSYVEASKILWMVRDVYSHKYTKYTKSAVITADDIQTILLCSKDYMVISFRGTLNFSNAISDLKFAYKAVDDEPNFTNTDVHKGFYNAVNSLWDHKVESVNNTMISIKSAVISQLKENPNSKIYITGHSLGGAIAAMLYIKIANLQTELPNIKLQTIQDIVYIYTYGQPKWCSAAHSTGMKDFANHYYRVVNPNDHVPGLPLKYWLRYSYDHLPGYEYNTVKGMIIKGSGQDVAQQTSAEIEFVATPEDLHIERTSGTKKVITVDDLVHSPAAIAYFGAAHAIELYVKQLQLIVAKKHSQNPQHENQTNGITVAQNTQGFFNQEVFYEASQTPSAQGLGRSFSGISEGAQMEDSHLIGHSHA